MPVASCRTRAPRQNSWTIDAVTKKQNAKQMPEIHTRTPSATSAPVPADHRRRSARRTRPGSSTSVVLRHASSGATPVNSSRMSPIGAIHLLKNGGPTVRRCAGHRFAQRREHRREEDEERREQQDPVVDEERRLARRPRVQLVPRPQQRQPIDDEAEADHRDRHHEAGEHVGQLPILAEGVHRLHDAGARHERAEDRQHEGDDHERRRSRRAASRGAPARSPSAGTPSP